MKSTIRGAGQLKPGTITVDLLSITFQLPMSYIQGYAKIVVVDAPPAMLANFNFGGYKGVNVADPVSLTDVVNLRTLNNAVSGMTGGSSNSYFPSGW